MINQPVSTLPQSPRVYRLDADRPNKTITSGHFRLGGVDPLGNRLGLTNTYLTWNDQPLYLISGEFHYSRYPPAYWEEELLKVKAGGVNTVATYVFWIFHEERPGVFDWAGQKNLRRFVELCARHGLKVILRIGPFAHGEWRNGGLPDWLYGQPFEVRSNAPGYLACVERLYMEIGQQVQGLLFKDGGPIIGIQLENEYMHAGAPWEVVDPTRELEWVTAGLAGADHLRALKSLAHKAQLDAPLYLVTAWGAPIIEDETLPVYGGYAYPVWVDNPAPSLLYLFQDGHAQPAESVTHRVPNHYPLIYAEMQGGIQVRYQNRPVVPPRSVEALALVCIGNGSNWLGYYMYHGGATPAGSHGFSHERLHPQRSYDFQAPLGEYGDYHASYHSLRLLHLFLESYGSALGPMGTLLPDQAGTIRPDNVSAVRYCVRARDGGGFLFVNNFQDHVVMQDIQDVAFEINTPVGAIRIPEAGGLTIRSEACFIFPFNQMLGDARLLYATAQPLTTLQHGDLWHYFYFAPDGIEAEFCLAEDRVVRVSGSCEQHATAGRLYLKPAVGQAHQIELETAGGQKIRITTLTRREAECAWKGAAWGAERVVVSAAGLTFVDDRLAAYAVGDADWEMSLWPPVGGSVAVTGAECVQVKAAGRTVLRLQLPATDIGLQVEPISARKYIVKLPGGIPAGLNDVFLKIDYEGDTGMAFVDGCLVADNFNNGTPWLIGLKRFARAALTAGVCFVFHPLRKGVVKNVSSQTAARFEFEGRERLSVQAFSAIPEHRLTIEFSR